MRKLAATVVLGAFGLWIAFEAVSKRAENGLPTQPLAAAFASLGAAVLLPLVASWRLFDPVGAKAARFWGFSPGVGTLALRLSIAVIVTMVWVFAVVVAGSR